MTCRGFAIVALLLLSTIATFAHATGIPSGYANLPYRFARKALINAGNKPVSVARPDQFACGGSYDVCAAYPETESCAVDRDRPCNFLWRTNDGKSFFVGTTGEEFSQITVVAIWPVVLRNGQWGW